MELRQLVIKSRDTVGRAAAGLVRLAKLERVLGLVCILIPALLILFDGLPIRGSISAYYDMPQDRVFYVPLTVASMLFVVNGVVKRRHFYDWVLGVMLAGVVLFDCDHAPAVHFSCATVFFGGNGVVILFFSSRKERPFKAVMATIIVAAMLGCFAFHWFTLFWAEWISLAIIALHYFIESGYDDGDAARAPSPSGDFNRPTLKPDTR